MGTEDGRSRGRHVTWALALVLVLAVLLLEAVGLPYGPSRRDGGRAASDGGGAPPDAPTAPPARLGPEPGPVDVAALLAEGRAGSREAWRVLAARSPDLDRDQRAQVRAAASVQLGYLVHPTADYRSGAEAVACAAAVADADVAGRLLALLDDWERVVLKLPLTEGRDDLAVLAAIRRGVERAGTPAQRARAEERIRSLEGDGREADVADEGSR